MGDVLDCEIQCFCALTDKGGPKVAPFKFSVPRRQKTSFAPELFPDCAGLKPICTIEEYKNGAEITKPYMMSMDPDVVIGDDGRLYSLRRNPMAIWKRKTQF